MKIVATMSLPAVDRPNDRWKAARSCQKQQDYVLAHLKVNSPEHLEKAKYFWSIPFKIA